ncbi:hypothetical protein [Stackebrandtia soli]|uniref:hypothetical protein n=1 Tax=Stackebrandtia soli TaxID=1892856 RepID=UPI0039ED9BB7
MSKHDEPTSSIAVEALDADSDTDTANTGPSQRGFRGIVVALCCLAAGLAGLAVAHVNALKDLEDLRQRTEELTGRLDVTADAEDALPDGPETYPQPTCESLDIDVAESPTQFIYVNEDGIACLVG